MAISETDYDRQLGPSGLEWLRIRIVTDNGQVTDFTVQYETTVGEQTMPVIRYDCAHGFPHADVYDLTGTQVAKEPMPAHLTLNENLQSAIRDLADNWEKYRNRFFGVPR